mmetsp:Transcript_12450/g.16044  ORF Transcript_12450/g.16044 Transcript_12450/m.16044 type:complete len:474 (+) Transcript_12450:45-1466(+)
MANKVAPVPDSSSNYSHVTLDPKVRRRVNGETELQMIHAVKVKKEILDTTVDGQWDIDQSLKKVDSLVLGYTGLYLIPKVLVWFLPIFILLLPFSFITKLYSMTLSAPTDVIKRGFGFYIYCIFATIFFIPAYLIILISRCCDGIFYYIFNLPYCFLFTKNGYKKYYKNIKIISPYNNGPSIILFDVYVCAIGTILRNGTIEFARCFTMMFITIPWLKYFVNCNPYVYDLDERFTQQISTSLDDCGVSNVSNTVKQIISRSKQDNKLRKRLDMWDFAPHYPYPPPTRNWAIGMQGVQNFVLLTHVTHADSNVLNSTTKEEKSQDKQSQESQQNPSHFVFSNSVEKPIWRVMLWYNNPYHFLTGYVEASISNGKPSQIDKKNGGEHPMWLISSHSPMLSDRTSFMASPGKIDAFFDAWLPVIVDEVRSLIRGPEIAKQMHQEVISKDGISRPSSKIGLPSETGDESKLVNPRLS